MWSCRAIPSLWVCHGRKELVLLAAVRLSSCWRAGADPELVAAERLEVELLTQLHSAAKLCEQLV